MRKIFTSLLILLLLTSCTNNSDDFKHEVNNAIEKALNAQITPVGLNNNQKTYYSFYQTKNIGKLTSNEITNQFIIDSNLCGLTLNIASILEEEIYSESKDFVLINPNELKDAIFVKKGTFINSSDKIVPYMISIAKDTERKYFILVQTNEFIFASLVENGNCSDTLFNMLVLLRSTNVDSKQVILDYASESVLATQSTIITLFKEILPESGTIIDYVDDWRDDSSFIIIEETIEE